MKDLPETYKPEALRELQAGHHEGKLAYGVFVEHEPGEYGGVYGPTPTVTECLEYVPKSVSGSKSLVIIRFNEDGTDETLYHWDDRVEVWIRRDKEFSDPSARRDDPSTSQEAGLSVTKKNVSDMMAMVLCVLSDGPKIDEDIIEAVAEEFPDRKLSYSGCRTRRGELCQAKLVECVGHGKTSLNKNAIVWGLTTLGEAVLEVLGYVGDEKITIEDAIQLAEEEVL